MSQMPGDCRCKPRLVHPPVPINPSSLALASGNSIKDRRTEPFRYNCRHGTARQSRFTFESLRV